MIECAIMMARSKSGSYALINVVLLLEDWYL